MKRKLTCSAIIHIDLKPNASAAVSVLAVPFYNEMYEKIKWHLLMDTLKQ